MVRAHRSSPRAFTGSPHWRQQGGVGVDPGAQRTAGGHQAGQSFSVARVIGCVLSRAGGGESGVQAGDQPGPA